MRSWTGRPLLSMGSWEGAGRSVQVTQKSFCPFFLFQSLQAVMGRMDSLLLLGLLPGNWACCCTVNKKVWADHFSTCFQEHGMLLAVAMS